LFLARAHSPDNHAKNNHLRRQPPSAVETRNPDSPEDAYLAATNPKCLLEQAHISAAAQSSGFRSLEPNSSGVIALDQRH